MALGLGSFEQDLKKQTQAFSGMSPTQLNQIANPTQKTRPDPNKGITPDLLKALAAQRLLKQKQAAENDLKASMEQDPRTVVQQQEEELQGLSLRETQSNVDKALANKQRQRNKTQNALNKLNPAQIAAMRNVSPSKPITRPLQDPRRAGIARAPVPRRMRSAQGGIVGYSNGGGIKKFNEAGAVKNDPYGIGALGELGIPRFDYSTNQDRTLVNLFKRILQGGMLKPEGGNTNTNVQPEVSNNIRPFVPINTGESAKQSLARRAAEKERRNIDKQLNLLRQAPDFSGYESLVDDSQLLSSTTNNNLINKFGDLDIPTNLGLPPNNAQLLSATNAGDKSWWDWLWGPKFEGESIPGSIIKRKSDSSEIIDSSGEETGPDINEKPELGDGSEEETGPEINTDGGGKVPANPTNNDSNAELRSKIQTYDNLLGIDAGGDPLQKFIYSISGGVNQIASRSLKYDNMIINRKLAAQDLLIRREANKMRLEGVRLTVLQDSVADLTKLLADKREEIFASGDYRVQLDAAEAVLADALESKNQQSIKEAEDAINLIYKQIETEMMELYSDEIAKLEAYENELKRRFGMSTVTSPNLKQEIDLNQIPQQT